jgi:hypothetical protein
MAGLEYGFEICDGCGVCETGSLWEVGRHCINCGMHQCYGSIDLTDEICEQKRYHERVSSCLIALKPPTTRHGYLQLCQDQASQR